MAVRVRQVDDGWHDLDDRGADRLGVILDAYLEDLNAVIAALLDTLVDTDCRRFGVDLPR